MPDVATSLHLRNVNELLLRLPLKLGFVEQPDMRVTYATRLHKVLTLLFGLSQDSAEHSLMPVKNFVDTLHNIYHFNYGVADRLQQSELILSATFDTAFEGYFHNLVDQIGPFLDTVFCHCQGFEGRSCADGYEAFTDFIREHQVQTGMLYSATPELTTDDLRTFKRTRFGAPLQEPGVSQETEQKQLQDDQQQWAKRYRSPEWQNEHEYTRLRLLSLERFFRSVWELRQLFPSSERIDAWRSAQDVYDDAARLLADALKENAEDGGFLIQAARNALLFGRVDLNEKREATKWFIKLGLIPAHLSEEEMRALGLSVEAAAEALKQPRVVKAPPAPLPPGDTSSVQVDILEDAKSKEAILTLARLPTRGRPEFLRQLTAALDGRCGPHVNVAFTYEGLRRLGLEPETLELLPKEFQEGMEQRGPVFGDYGWPNHADYWSLGGQQGPAALKSIDLLILFHRAQAEAAEPLLSVVDKLLRTWLGDQRDACVVHMEALGGVEPFGFKDPKVNQPELATYQAPPTHYTNRIAVGDVVLGHPDHRGHVAGFANPTENPKSSILFRNGTFLVVRKLAQNPAAYFDYVKKFNASTVDTLGADRSSSDTYDAVQDKDYPRISHRRRSNPRRPATARIVRRSFVYSGRPPANDNGAATGDTGHMFMCYNASIAEQFEVIQRWVNGGNSTGLLSSRTDLVAGQHVPYLLAQDATRVPHVMLRWGLYAFVPSRVAMEKLTELISDEAQAPQELRRTLREADEHARVCRGLKLLSDLDAIKDPELARLSWKELFETNESARDARAVWAAIRSQKRPKQTAYGLLVGDAETALTILSDESRFSVAEYHKRFQRAGFDFYLGSDHARCPHNVGAARSYKTMSKANEYLRSELRSEELFKSARHSAAEFLTTTAADDEARKRSMRFDVRDLARHVVGDICREYIGIPAKIADRAVLNSFLDYFAHITRYSSFPYPESCVEQLAITAGDALRTAYRGESLGQLGLGRKLVAEGYDAIDPNAVRDAIIIANIGFVPPALSMLVLMLTKWLDNRDIEQPQLRDEHGAYAAVLNELRHVSTFPTMYRTALDGNGLTSPGSFVIVGIQSAMTEDLAAHHAEPERWMFGGEYGKTAHGCPMREGALRILAGAVMELALFVHKQARAGRQLTTSGPLTYRFETIGRVLPGKDRPAMPA